MNLHLNAEQWNALFPVGTPVVAYPDVRPEYPPRSASPITPAWRRAPGEPVVAVDGYAGGISLEHIDLNQEQQ